MNRDRTASLGEFNEDERPCFLNFTPRSEYLAIVAVLAIRRCMMKLQRFLPGMLVALFLLTGVRAKADSWSYYFVCDAVFGSSGGCYADDYIPNMTVWELGYFTDCTFTSQVGGNTHRYHTSAHSPDYHTGWNYYSWGVTSDFRTVDSDSGFKYQQLVDGSWQDITPCDP
jgi:hypothetical protein